MSVLTPHTIKCPKGEVEQAGYITSAMNPPQNQDLKTYNPKMNGLVHILYKIMNNVVASVSEEKFGT